MKQSRKIKGAGLGLRAPHYREIKETLPPIPWFEILIDNYFVKGGAPLENLDFMREHYPIVFHGVGMNLGSTNPLDLDYLLDLLERIRGQAASDLLQKPEPEGNSTNS